MGLEMPESQLGERVKALETMAQAAATAHAKLGDKIDDQKELLLEIRAGQMAAAEKFLRGEAIMNRHTEEIRALQDDKLDTNATVRTLKKVAWAGWVLVAFVAGLFGVHLVAPSITIK